MIPVPYYFTLPEKPLGPAALDAWMSDVDAVIAEPDGSRLTVFFLLDHGDSRLIMALDYDTEGRMSTKGFFARGVAVTRVQTRTGDHAWVATGGFPPEEGHRAKGLYRVALPRDVRRALEGPWLDAGVQQRLLTWKLPTAA